MQYLRSLGKKVKRALKEALGMTEENVVNDPVMVPTSSTVEEVVVEPMVESTVEEEMIEHMIEESVVEEEMVEVPLVQDLGIVDVQPMTEVEEPEINMVTDVSSPVSLVPVVEEPVPMPFTFRENLTSAILSINSHLKAMEAVDLRVGNAEGELRDLATQKVLAMDEKIAATVSKEEVLLNAVKAFDLAIGVLSSKRDELRD